MQPSDTNSTLEGSELETISVIDVAPFINKLTRYIKCNRLIRAPLITASYLGTHAENNLLFTM